MKMKKIGAILSAGIILTGLVGCGGNKTSSTEQKEADSSDTNFRIATVRWADWGDDFQKGFVEDSEKEAGISVDWDVYLNADWADKKSVLLAGDDLPDAFWGSITLTDTEIAQNSSLFIPLEDLIDENMPNLKKAFEEDPALKAMVTSPDGHIYSLPKKLPMRPLIDNQLFINKKWLDNLGLEMPDTYEDFYNVLKAFKEEDANGNGDPNDEIPYGAGNADAVFSFILPFDNRKGHDQTYLMSVENDKPVYLPVQENYKEGIEWMHKAYADGLIDKEIFTQDQSMSDAKRMNKDLSLVGVAVGWTADATFGPNASEYVPLQPVKGPDGERYINSDPQHYNYGRNELLITTKCENPAALLKWADQFYTDDASIQTFYGSFGVGVEKDGDKYTVLPPQNGESADSWAWINSFRDFGPKYVGDDFNSRVTLPEESGDGLKLKMDAELNKFAKPAFPNVTYSPEELTKLASIYTDMDSYVKQMQSKWVVEGGIEKDWDSYLKQLKQMGYDDFIKIQTDAYNRYVESTK